MKEPSPSPFQQFKILNRPGVQYSKRANATAGTCYAKGDHAGTLAVLDADASDPRNRNNGHAPVNLQVLNCPPVEDLWVIKESIRVQRHILGLSHVKVEKAIAVGKLDTTTRALIYEVLGLTPVHGLYAQTENSILKNALARYTGEIDKFDNRNDKILAKHKDECREAAFYGRCAPDAPELVSALGADGCLLHKPGDEHKHYFNNAYKIEAYDSEVHGDLGLSVAYCDPTKPIPRLRPRDIALLKQAPKLKRLKEKLVKGGSELHSCKAEKIREGEALSRRLTLPVVIRAASSDMDGGLQVVADGRGLLDCLKRKGIYPTSMVDALGYFTTGFVLWPQRGEPKLQARLKPEWTGYRVLDVRKVKAPGQPFLEGWKGAKYLADLRTTEPFVYVPIDLGVTKILSASISRIEGTTERHLGYFSIPGRPCSTLSPANATELKANLDRCVGDYGRITDVISDKAKFMLTADQRAEFERWDNRSLLVKNALLSKYPGLSTLCWGRLHEKWDAISTHLTLSGYGPDVTTYTSSEIEETAVAKGKTKIAQTHERKVKSNGYYIRDASNEFKMSAEARSAHTLLERELQKTDPDFRRKAKALREAVKRCLNSLLMAIRSVEPSLTIVFAIERLNPQFISRKWGKRRGCGLDHYITRRQLKSWHMRMAITELRKFPEDKGILVLEGDPRGTSIKCPECGHWDKHNRNSEDREGFKCVKCGYTADADIQVGAINIGRVVLSGKPLSKKPPASGVATEDPLEPLALGPTSEYASAKPPNLTAIDAIFGSPVVEISEGLETSGVSDEQDS